MGYIKNMDDHLVKLRKYNIVNKELNLYQDSRNNNLIKIINVDENLKLDMNLFYRTIQNIDVNIKHIIFIYYNATIQTKKLKNFQNVVRIELFNFNELKRLIIGNRFIPEHRQLNEFEENEFIEKFDKTKLPEILLTDPMVKLHNFDLNAIIEIKREDGIYYRLVTNDS